MVTTRYFKSRLSFCLLRGQHNIVMHYIIHCRTCHAPDSLSAILNSPSIGFIRWHVLIAIVCSWVSFPSPVLTKASLPTLMCSWENNWLNDNSFIPFSHGISNQSWKQGFGKYMRLSRPISRILGKGVY